MDYLIRAEHYRVQADRCRQEAAKATLPQVRAQWLTLATQYDQLRVQMLELSAINRERPTR